MGALQYLNGTYIYTGVIRKDKYKGHMFLICHKIVIILGINCALIHTSTGQ